MLSTADRRLLERVRERAGQHSPGWLARELDIAKGTAAGILAGKFPSRMTDAMREKLVRWAGQGTATEPAKEPPTEITAYWLREWEQMQSEPGLVGLARQLRLAELNATLRDYSLAKLAEAAAKGEESAVARARAAERTAPPPESAVPPLETYTTPPTTPAKRRRA